MSRTISRKFELELAPERWISIEETRDRTEVMLDLDVGGELLGVRLDRAQLLELRKMLRDVRIGEGLPVEDVGEPLPFSEVPTVLEARTDLDGQRSR